MEDTNNKEGQSEVGELIKKHLLRIRYHVFQWVDITLQRDSVDQNFTPEIDQEYANTRWASKMAFRGKPPYYESAIKHKSFQEVENYMSEIQKNKRYFKTSSGEKALLGRIALLKGFGKEGQSVLAHGMFSTESSPTLSNRHDGRTNRDNQILFVFDNKDSADRFCELFKETTYVEDPKDVEANVKLIEETIESLGLTKKNVEYIKSRLLLGLELKKKG